MCEFGDIGNDTSCVKQLNLSYSTWEDYRDTRFYKGDCALVIKRWINRVEEDVSGLTFQVWTPDVDTSRSPVSMMINSSELHATGFKVKELCPPTLEAVVRCGLWTRGTGLWSLEGMVPKRFVLSVDDDTEFRSRCEWIIPFFGLKYSIFPSNLFKKKKSRGAPTPQDGDAGNSVWSIPGCPWPWDQPKSWGNCGIETRLTDKRFPSVMGDCVIF